MVHLTDLKGQTRMNSPEKPSDFEEMDCVDTSKTAR